MDTDHVKVQLLSLPERYRLALLSLPAGTSRADAQRSLELCGQREADDAARLRCSPMDLAARQTLQALGANATLDAADQEYVKSLQAKSTASAKNIVHVDDLLEETELRLRDCKRRGGPPGNDLDLKRAHREVASARCWVGALALIDLGLSTPIAIELAGVTHYPDPSYVPVDVWITCGAYVAGLGILVVLVPVLVARRLHGVELTPRLHRALRVTAVGAIVTGLASVALARLSSAVHFGGDLLPEVAMGTLLVVATFLGAACTAAFEYEAVATQRRLGRLRGTDEAGSEAGALAAERDRLIEQRRALQAEVDAPQTERQAFRTRLSRAQADVAHEDLVNLENVDRCLHVYDAMEALSPAGRRHLSTIFRIVDAPKSDDDAQPPAEV